MASYSNMGHTVSLQSEPEQHRGQKTVSSLVCAATVLAVAIVMLILGIMVGRFAFQFHNVRSSESDRMLAEMGTDFTDWLLSEVHAENINGYLKNLSQQPHLAGSPEDLKQAEWIWNHFLDSGFDSVSLKPYHVLLSYPDSDHPNKIEIYDEKTHSVVFTSRGRQERLWSPEESNKHIIPPFSAFSASGNITGQLIYANYGRQKDFKLLEDKGISVRNHIVIAKHGRKFRGRIAKYAEQRGAIGLILFSDPKDYAPEGQDFVYPKSIWLPGQGVQSGTIYLSSGDPQTPHYPSTESAYRLPLEKVVLPKIPVQPIGYDDAERILREMSPFPGEETLPQDWKGNLNVSYSLGPGFKNPNLKVKMDIRTSTQLVTTYNVIGTIRGQVEPDRHVLLGNHRDAWMLGAVDPSSGTAALMELARVFGKLKKDLGWRPRRSVSFCSWGAEEYGLIGSIEWTEEYAKKLTSQAVAYLNIDMAVNGNDSLRVLSVPLLHQTLFDAARKIPNPNPDEITEGRSSVFDTWKVRRPADSNSELPKVSTVGSTSDYMSFQYLLGVPCADIRYTYQKKEASSFPLYHTLYATHHAVSSLLDRGFHYHVAVTQMWGEMAHILADSLILPFSIQKYSSFLVQGVNIIKNNYQQVLEQNSISLRYFEESVANFSAAVDDFQLETVGKVDKTNPMELRQVNDKLMQIERSFIDQNGIPDNENHLYRHVVLTPSSQYKLPRTGFAGIADLLHQLELQLSTNERENVLDKVQQHLAAVTHHIKTATHVLSDDF